jgi:mRNA interferase MazF
LTGITQGYVPDRGDLVWLDFNPTLGHEQAGYRPALVLSNAKYNTLSGMAVVCPITNQAKGYSFEVQIPAGLQVTGVILADQITSIAWAERNAIYKDCIPLDDFKLVIGKILSLLTKG